MKSINIIVVLAIQLALVRSDFANDVLKAHNKLRAQHSAPPLKLDVELSKGCSVHAKKMSDQGKMEHSGGNYGENLYVTLGSPLGCTQAWYKEIKDYNFKKAEFSLKTGHFTQVIWKNSRKLGVGMYTGANKKTYVVCRYTPQGNIKNTFNTNVLPLYE